MERPINILLIDDDENLFIIYENLLKQKLEYPFIFDNCLSSESLEKILSERKYDIIILDQRLNNGIKGIDLIPMIKKDNLCAYIIINSAYSSETLAIDAMRNGANNYVNGNKEDNQSLMLIIKKGIEMIHKVDDIETLSQKMKGFSQELNSLSEKDLNNTKMKFAKMSAN